MSRIRLSMLLSAVVAVSLIAAPALAQAEEVQIEGAASEGGTIQAASSNLEFQAGGITVSCPEADLSVWMIGNAFGIVTGGGFKGKGGGACETSVGGADVTINATFEEPWFVQFESFGSGGAGLIAMAEEEISFIAQLQMGGSSVITCTYSAVFASFTYNTDGEDLQM